MRQATFAAEFDRLTYPAGERHVRARDLDALRRVSTIEATVRTFDDLAEIVVADRILRRNDIAVEWFLPYFPFARHDRRIDPADGFELDLALEMVRELDVVIADPHSDVAGQLRHFPQRDVVVVMQAAGAFVGDPVVVVPDAGAAKKAGEWVGSMPTVQALKVRDPRTGRLSGFRVLADEDQLAGRPCVIVDDLCDGGGTFLGLAAELERLGAGPLTLVVTHGLFTKGLDRLAEVFDRVWCFAPTDEVPVRTTTGCLTRLPFRMLHEKGTPR